MKYSNDKDINNNVAELVRLGWQFSHRGKHGKLTSPIGKSFLTVPCSPSDRNSFKNFRRDVQRCNLTYGY